ncbi:hypothetical protein C8Q76DRAFT_772206 [Earliella scabrosa]|nr:hypothetical protein C8Q76DRAFT_772206 [Earliella scabrosa]
MKHDVPIRVARQQATIAARNVQKQALKDLKKLLGSKQDLLAGGANSLQAYRARSIQACLSLMDRDQIGLMEASEVAARGNLFSGQWGVRLVCQWTNEWVKSRTLPESRRGRHSKTVSLLSDPTVRAAVRVYIRSQKWLQDPVKLQKLLNNELNETEAQEYKCVLISEEMPDGLKQFVTTHILPDLQLKPSRLGLSCSSMCRLLLSEGFTWSEHRKAAHNGRRFNWLLNGESLIRKKGPGRDLHQSDFICSTVGWLSEASVTLEYGKNHDGFWNGELFCKQLTEKFFPAFKKAHGDGHIAVVLVDNSQGHACYAPDALRVTKMNFNPGGAQPHMRDGWYTHNGRRIIQPMVFPSTHPQHPNQPKGMKALIRKFEHHAWRFIDAYAEGLDARDAQKKVKEFSSRKYKSHHQIPEQLAQAMDVELKRPYHVQARYWKGQLSQFGLDRLSLLAFCSSI